MTPPNGMVWAGIDTHTDTHTIALLDERGRPLGSETFAANPDGYDRLIDMLPGPGAVAAVGVEGTNSFGAALAREGQKLQSTCLDALFAGLTQSEAERFQELLEKVLTSAEVRLKEGGNT